PSDWSDVMPVAVNFSVIIPDTPSDFSVPSTDEDGTYQITWTEVSDATKYEVQEDTSENFTNPQKHFATTTGLNISDKPEGTYYYRIRSWIDDVPSDWSEVISVTVELPVVPPEVPSDEDGADDVVPEVPSDGDDIPPEAPSDKDGAACFINTAFAQKNTTSDDSYITPSQTEKSIQRKIEELIEQMRKGRDEAIKAIVKIGKPAVPALITALKDGNSSVQQRAVEALGKIGDSRAVPHLITALKDEHCLVRERAAEALGKIGDSRVVPDLIIVLKDEDEFVREKAAEALGKIGDTRVLEPLKQALKNPANQEIKDTIQKAIEKLKAHKDNRSFHKNRIIPELKEEIRWKEKDSSTELSSKLQQNSGKSDVSSSTKKPSLWSKVRDFCRLGKGVSYAAKREEVIMSQAVTAGKSDVDNNYKEFIINRTAQVLFQGSNVIILYKGKTYNEDVGVRIKRKPPVFLGGNDAYLFTEKENLGIRIELKESEALIHKVYVDENLFKDLKKIILILQLYELSVLQVENLKAPGALAKAREELINTAEAQIKAINEKIKELEAEINSLTKEKRGWEQGLSAMIKKFREIARSYFILKEMTRIKKLRAEAEDLEKQRRFAQARESYNKAIKVAQKASEEMDVMAKEIVDSENAAYTVKAHFSQVLAEIHWETTRLTRNIEDIKEALEKALKHYQEVLNSYQKVEELLLSRKLINREEDKIKKSLAMLKEQTEKITLFIEKKADALLFAKQKKYRDAIGAVREILTIIQELEEYSDQGALLPLKGSWQVKLGDFYHNMGELEEAKENYLAARKTYDEGEKSGFEINGAAKTYLQLQLDMVEEDMKREKEKKSSGNTANPGDERVENDSLNRMEEVAAISELARINEPLQKAKASGRIDEIIEVLWKAGQGGISKEEIKAELAALAPDVAPTEKLRKKIYDRWIIYAISIMRFMGLTVVGEHQKPADMNIHGIAAIVKDKEIEVFMPHAQFGKNMTMPFRTALQNIFADRLRTYQKLEDLDKMVKHPEKSIVMTVDLKNDQINTLKNTGIDLAKTRFMNFGPVNIREMTQTEYENYIAETLTILLVARTITLEETQDKGSPMYRMLAHLLESHMVDTKEVDNYICTIVDSSINPITKLRYLLKTILKAVPITAYRIMKPAVEILWSV
ncbi:MAG: HEAT repeat domain-containing protein, partial [Candidatus Omnitrophota bacterium]